MPDTFISTLFVSLALATTALAAPNYKTKIEANDLLTGKPISVELKASTPAKKALVVVFLSAVCPCSNSHVQELIALHKDFPDFEFVAVHSNTDEDKELSTGYFAKLNLPFPIVQDTGAKIADDFRALKTPHAFVVNAAGEALYRGGVSTSKEFVDAKKKLLREALEDIQKGQTLRTAESRVLGCTISRGAKNVW